MLTGLVLMALCSGGRGPDGYSLGLSSCNAIDYAWLVCSYLLTVSKKV
jgi:hypothetical protein